MAELLIYFGIAMIAYYIGWHIRGVFFLYHLSEHPDNMIKILEQIKKINDSQKVGLPVDAIEVETEQVNGNYYAYNKITGEFLAQAGNLNQVMVLAAKRYPGKKFWHPELKEDNQTA